MTYARLHISPLGSLASAARTLGQRLRAAWRTGPVPCWTEYLHETRDTRN